jgi:hypothetical protein
MYALLQSFRKPSMIQTAPLNDAMRCDAMREPCHSAATTLRAA